MPTNTLDEEVVRLLRKQWATDQIVDYLQDKRTMLPVREQIEDAIQRLSAWENANA